MTTSIYIVGDTESWEVVDGYREVVEAIERGRRFVGRAPNTTAVELKGKSGLLLTFFAEHVAVVAE